MPNWNYNSVTVHAPLKEVMKYLIQDEYEQLVFNMHLLYPEIFDENDLDGQKNWDYEWAVENT
jgi:hypothetical protein